uniref:Uncharacterized protein n=1 Tax=Arundo donax TaxID=35708 RepID=A0A0A9FWJ6_ARUDO
MLFMIPCMALLSFMFFLAAFTSKVFNNFQYDLESGTFPLRTICLW